MRHLIFWKYWHPDQYGTRVRGGTVTHYVRPGYWVHRWDIPWSYVLLGAGLFVMATSFSVLQVVNYAAMVRSQPCASHP